MRTAFVLAVAMVLGLGACAEETPVEAEKMDSGTAEVSTGPLPACQGDVVDLTPIDSPYHGECETDAYPYEDCGTCRGRWRLRPFDLVTCVIKSPCVPRP